MKRAALVTALALSLLAPVEAEAHRTKRRHTHRRPVAARRAPAPVAYGEVGRALGEAGREFGVDLEQLRRIAWCESRFNPTASNGTHMGLMQQSVRYWPGRVAAFNRAVDPDVRGVITDPFDNARVSSWMLAAPGGARHWTCK